jgi:hypothetical protein
MPTLSIVVPAHGDGYTDTVASPRGTAFDAIRDFRPDHILIALRGADHDAWQERHLIDDIRLRFHIPITVFELDRAGHVPPCRGVEPAPQCRPVAGSGPCGLAREDRAGSVRADGLRDGRGGCSSAPL